MSKKLWTVILTQAMFCYCYSQERILPGDKSIDKSYIKSELTTMGFYVKSDDKVTDIGIYEIEISVGSRDITVNSTLYFKNDANQWKDICVVDAGSYAAFSYTCDRDDRNYKLDFSKSISGTFTNKQTKETKKISESIKEKYFDYNFYPHILKALPLKLGYKAIIPVYDYEAADKSKLYNVVLSQVKSAVFSSAVTGKHDAWSATVFEESTGHNFEYLIDKKSRRIWQINIVSKDGQPMSLLDREADYNPMTEKFDKDATKKMITKGTASITGQVFGRANKNDESWAVIVNWNPKQVARKGTAVYLIPYTAWYKEYFKVNRDLKKEGRKFNMPKEALECILVSRIYDDKGHFEFTNLMPGEYFVYSQFEFFEKHHQDVIVGSREVFVNDTYQGTQDITHRHRWSQLEYAFSEELVTIEKDGVVKELKLKKQKKSQVL